MPKINIRTWRWMDDVEQQSSRITYAHRRGYDKKAMKKAYATKDAITISQHGQERIKDRNLWFLERGDVIRSIAQGRVYRDIQHPSREQTYKVIGINSAYIINDRMTIITVMRYDAWFWMAVNRDRFKKLSKKDIKKIFGIKPCR